jgi:hypothetical protein
MAAPPDPKTTTSASRCQGNSLFANSPDAAISTVDARSAGLAAGAARGLAPSALCQIVPSGIQQVLHNWA